MSVSLKAIKQQTKVSELKKLSAQKQEIFKTLVENDVSPQIIQLVMSKIADAFNKKLIDIYLNEHEKAPCNFAWIAAGVIFLDAIMIIVLGNTLCKKK